MQYELCLSFTAVRDLISMLIRVREKEVKPSTILSNTNKKLSKSLEFDFLLILTKIQ